MVYDSFQKISVLFGGGYVEDDDYYLYDDTWEFDGIEWQKKQSEPEGRALHAMTFDTHMQRTLMYGGAGVRNFWARQGQDWQLLDDTLGPGTPRDRFGHSLVFDTRRGVALLFGGDSMGEPRNDLWEWDGSEWTLLDTPVAPPARAFHAMVYDPGRHRLVLFGGKDADGQWLSDTWVYNLPPPSCYPDLDQSAALDFFDFLAFLNLFKAEDPAADCDGSGGFDLFDFLCFVNAFETGC